MGTYSYSAVKKFMDACRNFYVSCLIGIFCKFLVSSCKFYESKGPLECALQFSPYKFLLL